MKYIITPLIVCSNGQVKKADRKLATFFGIYTENADFSHDWIMDFRSMEEAETFLKELCNV